jgi:hypothetical protein
MAQKARRYIEIFTKVLIRSYILCLLNNKHHNDIYYLKEVGSNFKKKYQVLNFLPDDMFWAEKTNKLLFFLVAYLCVGYQLWISTNDAF